MATLTLRIPDDLDRELERQSSASRLSKSDLAREALQRYLRVANLQTLRSELVPHAQAQGINTDEDVFRALNKS
jgi:predicted transcriptional regulator